MESEASSSAHKIKHKRRFNFRRLGYWLAGILIVLVALRLALPSIVQSYVNHQLNKNKNYAGKIGDVDIHLWRGAYQINHIEIFKRSGQIKEPFFATDVLDLSIEWKELFHGAIVGEVVMEKPRINFVSGPTAEQSQAGEKTDWNDTLKSLFPFKLNRFEIRNGQAHFQNHFSKPPVDIYFNQLAAVATNLTNTRNIKQPLPSGITARAKTLGDGQLDFNLKLNVLTKPPQFELEAGLTNVNLVALNDFLEAYGKFDVDRGNFALFTSVAGKEGRFDGYVKVLFNDLDVFQWQKEKKKNVLEIFWQAIVGTVTTLFKNQPKDQLATKVPISGAYGNSQVGIWATITELLHNAFIRALVPKLDEKVTVQKVDQEIKENKLPEPQPEKATKKEEKKEDKGTNQP